MLAKQAAALKVAMLTTRLAAISIAHKAYRLPNSFASARHKTIHLSFLTRSTRLPSAQLLPAIA
jgi:hypothetical protein